MRFTGSLPREEALRCSRAGSEAALLASDWENLPHAAVEALAVGTPVVATAVGGVPEVVHDGENGLLVAPRDGPRSSAAALRRIVGDPALRDRWPPRRGRRSRHLSRDEVYGRLEAMLVEAALCGTALPRVLFVGRPVHDPAPGLAREEVGRGRRQIDSDLRVPNAGQPSTGASASCPAPLDGLFYPRLPFEEPGDQGVPPGGDRGERPVHRRCRARRARASRVGRR